jgi:hypothetical protein
MRCGPHLRRLLAWLHLICAAAAASVDSAEAADSQKRVLVLYTTRRDAQIVIIGERELPSMFENGLRSIERASATSSA